MPTSVFISSTSRDLLDHRAAVVNGLRKAGYHPIDMADFMARPDGAVRVCLQEVAEADLFVGIYGWRYGFIPEDSEVSITEQEFLEAERLGKPCFCFVVDETYPWPEEHIEQGIGARLLRAFKAMIDAKLVRTTFTSPDNLAGHVLASLSRWEREQVKQDEIGPAQGTANIDQRINTIKAGHVQTGGEFHVENFEVDLSDTRTETNYGSVGTVVQGDQFNLSGNFQGAVLNIKSQLENVTQTIGALPDVDPADKEEFVYLINELKAELSQVPPDKAAEAEKVSKRVESLVEEFEADQPDAEMIDIMGNSLKKAAQNLAGAMPTVLTIATQIVAHALKLAG